jgi:hypothetical protein
VEERIELSEPFKNLEGISMSYVTMRTKLNVGDWRWANKQTKDPEERTFHMVCRLCALDAKEVDQFCMADFQLIASKISLGDAPDPKG